MEATKTNFSNSVTYRRKTKDEKNPYTQISNSLLDDEKINDIEKIIMIKILKNSDSFIFNKSYEESNSTFGRDLYRKSINHLIELGYLSFERYRRGGSWTITECPSDFNTTESSPIKSNRVESSPIKSNRVESSPIKSNRTESSPTEIDPLINTNINKENIIINNNIINNNINKENNKKDNILDNINIKIDNLEQLEQPTVEVPVEKIYQPSNHSFLNFPRGLKVTKEVKEVNVIEEDEFSTKVIKKELEATEEPKEIYLIFKKWFSNAPGTPSDKVYDFKTIFSTEKILSLGEYMTQEHVQGHNAIKKVINEVTVAVEEQEDKEDEDDSQLEDYEKNKNYEYQY